jgi:hypothetical protein
MTIRRFTVQCILITLVLVFLAPVDQTGQAQSKKGKYACSEPDPASVCTASNTCGSASEPCAVDVKRTNYGASATPAIAGAKGNSTFCVKTGMSVTWKSDTKHVGFVVDMGPTSPFDPPDDIIGGSNRSVTAVAKTPGCYKYSVGACISGEIYGMCGNSTAELVIVK